jgi:hypothetical protein
MAGLPSNWQETTLKALEELKRDPNLYGVGLPLAWSTELSEFHRSGELRKLLGVRRTSFVKGDKIVALKAETPPSETKTKSRQ